jgi:hypothetical protein
MASRKPTEEEVEELRMDNRLIYDKPANRSLINQRTLKSYNFSNNTYELGNTMQCIINSGADAIWGPSSYLRLQFDGGATFSVGNGSMYNIFKSVRLTHRSGEVLEFVQSANLLANVKRNWMTSEDDRRKLNAVIGGEVTTDVQGVDSVVSLPLSYLLGVFDRTDQYIPPGFLAGAKLEMELDSIAIVSPIASGGTNTLANLRPTLVLDSSQVYDSVQKQLLDEQADSEKSGIQFSYSTWFNTNASFSGTSVNFDVQQSASLTMKAFAVIRDNASLAAGADSFTQDNGATLWQWRLASQYYPQQAIVNSANEPAESYGISLQAMESYPHQFSMNMGGRGSAVTLANYRAKDAIYATSLEKSAAGLSLSGESSNNSRLLNLEMTKLAVNDRVDVYLQYLRVANVIGANLIVDR